MKILSWLNQYVWQVFIEALFPLSKEEIFLNELTPEHAFEVLPKAPVFDNKVVPLPDTKAVFAYKDKRVARLVWNIKYKKDKHSIDIAVFAMLKNLNVGEAGKIYLVPIPTTPKRLRERGYNQTELLIDAMVRGDKTGQVQSLKDLLVRTKDQKRSKYKNRQERLSDAKELFAVNIKNQVSKDTQIIVIDDVITTGSTMKQALDVLRACDFIYVRGLAIAH